ncbi:extracellular solute-binding protein [Clostridium sp. MCC353]|uniref:extracellular solute-binding protein n=1 Tax=Clostridium sp. MCC353 TaxID=2592646 RepID=UPI001C0392F8|nr:extracellular solute-binding protein [Clostridium sp. MCC353]MBT9775117.1 extracellular solute-binding protein [Clostridium sp. MCC353]
MKKQKFLSIVLALNILSAMSGCVNSPREMEVKSRFCPENEILTYEPVDFDKTVITIGAYAPCNSDPVELAIEAQFPDIDIVILEKASIPDIQTHVKQPGVQKDLEDILFTGYIRDMEVSNSIFYDLSAEAFTSLYNQSVLNSMSTSGKLYQLPINSSIQGIFYNKSLFEAHGWEIPETIEAFYDLCDEISAQGIRPFVPCFKYSPDGVGLGFSNRAIFSTMDKREQYDLFCSGQASCKGVLEPYFEVHKTLYDRGIVVEGDFSTSLTKNRHALYAGEIAMLPEQLTMFSLYEDERPECEIGFFGYPSDTPGERWMQMMTGRSMALSKASMEDPDKKQALLDILTFLSTNEGQAALLEVFSGLSSVKSAQADLREEFWDVQKCIENGQIFYASRIGNDLHNQTLKEYLEGRLTLEQALDQTDAMVRDIMADRGAEEFIGTAAEEFTILETSTFIADAMRSATGAEIALIPHNTYYVGNLAKFYEGDVTMLYRFYLRGLGTGDCLTTYEITGANLKKLMEHPIINGQEVNALYAFSGLNMEYAPWRPWDENVIKLALADGSGIEDDKRYTVAAWPTSIDQSYLASIRNVHSEIGSNIDLVSSAVKQAGTISPAEDHRLTLRWD